jgi:penicillin-binding protein 1C
VTLRRESKALLSRWRFRVPLLIAALGVCTLVGVRVVTDMRYSAATLELPSCRIIQDRSGEVLYFEPNDRGERHRAVDLSEVPPQLQAAFLAAEDDRFHRHGGVDVIALFRAVKDNFLSRKIVSGASTITMQLVRFNSDSERSISVKIKEGLEALTLERRMAKGKILERYLNGVPMGNNIRGVALAAECYFGSQLKDLSLAQCATLAALPKAPSAMDPVDGDLERLSKRRHWILARMAVLGYIDTDQQLAAEAEQVVAKQPAFPHLSPHLCQRLLRQAGSPEVWSRKGVNWILDTALDADHQRNADSILRSHQTRILGLGATQIAMVLVRNEDRAVLAQVGSFEWSDQNGGFNDGTRAKRSSGSTLKPLLYALALDMGQDPAAFLEDLGQVYATPGGEYCPRNASGEQFGPVSMRTAMSSSLNLSAIGLVRSMGVDRCLRFLERCGLPAAKGADSAHYGLGLAVGNLEVTLEDLVAAYAALADGGEWRTLRFVEGSEPMEARQILSRGACWIIADMLSDPSARTLGFKRTPLEGFPGPVSIKTGTSNRNRDAWIVGFTSKYTLGIWVGNFDGSSTARLAGMDACEPILADMLRCLYGDSSPGSTSPPPDVEVRTVCSYSGLIPTEFCSATRPEWFLKDNPPKTDCIFHRSQGDRHELPVAFAGWMSDRNPDVVGGSWSLSGRSAPGTAAIADCASVGMRVTYPQDNDHFHLEQSGARYLVPLRVRLDRPVPWVRWFVDGVELAQVGPPFEAEWELRRGEHRISVCGPDMYGTEISLYVD